MPQTDQLPATGELRSDAVSARHLVFFVVSAAAPLTVMAGFAPLGFLVGGQTAPVGYLAAGDRKSTRLNSSHVSESRMPSSA